MGTLYLIVSIKRQKKKQTKDQKQKSKRTKLKENKKEPLGI